MLSNIDGKIKKVLDKFLGKNVLIIQEESIESSFNITEFNYEIILDICRINDKKTKNYLNFNLNQIYKTEEIKNSIKLYFDNDVNIKLLIKK